MPADAPSPSGVPPDERAWGRTRQKWCVEPAPWLHGEVARRMAERLPLIRQAPGSILDWDTAGSASHPALAAACPGAVVQGVQDQPGAPTPWPAQALPHNPDALDPSDAPQGAGASAWWARLKGLFRAGAAPTSHPSPPARQPVLSPDGLPLGQADLVWSNMGLHTHGDPARVLAQWHQALAVDGFLMFSTFGPDTLRELTPVWKAHGWGPAAQPFVDMHDWGDALVHAGFADPVMDQETIRLTWASPSAALQELRGLGRNAHPGRFTGLRTPRWQARMQDALASLAGPDGRVALTFEIIYGHAFRPAPRPVVAGTTTVSLQDMRAMVQTTRHRQ